MVAAAAPTCRAPSCSPSACAPRIEALDCRCSTGAATAARDRQPRRRGLPAVAPRTRTRWWPRPTPRSTRPSGREEPRAVRDAPDARPLGSAGMGLLDDAIREHLELKRRAGADPERVARLEQRGARSARRERRRPRSPSPRRGAERRLRAPEPEPEPTVAGAPRSSAPPPSRRSPSRTPEPRRRERRADEPDRSLADDRAERRLAADAPSSRSPSAEDARPGAAAADTARRGGRGRRARGDAGLPAGDAGARPALVRAAPAARLRLRPIAAASRCTWLDVFTAEPLAGQRARRRPRRRRARRRDDAALRARDAPVGDDLRAAPEPSAPTTATASSRSTRELPFAGHPSLGTAVAVAPRARRARRPATSSRRSAGLQPIDVELDGAARPRVDAAGARRLRRRADRARVLGSRRARARRAPIRDAAAAARLAPASRS